MGFREILVCHDFSEDSTAALDLALELARPLSASLHLLHVWQRPVEILSPYEVPLPASVAQEARARANRRLEEEAERVRRAGVPVRASLREGSPAETIAETVRELGADVVVMGTRGRTGLAHVLLGSVAERTLRLAPCPVLTVKAKPAA